MPEHPIIAIPKAIAEDINEQDFGVAFVARRSYANWRDRLEDQDALQVDVVPVNKYDPVLHDRSEIASRLSVDIVVRKRFGSSESDSDGNIAIEEVDALVQLTANIGEHYVADRVPDIDNAVWQETKVMAAYVPSHLRELRQFTGHVRITFEAYTAIP